MMTRVFLATVGTAYILLAGWCAAMPEKTSGSVGFTLQRGAGQSEFLTVYGGLQLALGLAFLWPLIQPSQTAHTLFICLLIHACLVALRTVGFLQFSGIPTMTWYLAASEWVIFLAAAALFWRKG